MQKYEGGNLYSYTLFRTDRIVESMFPNPRPRTNRVPGRIWPPTFILVGEPDNGPFYRGLLSRLERKGKSLGRNSTWIGMEPLSIDPHLSLLSVEKKVRETLFNQNDV